MSEGDLQWDCSLCNNLDFFLWCLSLRASLLIVKA
jgi:hypothetical protein